VAGILDRLAVVLSRDPAHDGGIWREGQLGIPDVLDRQVPRHLVGQRPQVLGRADQVDHREIDGDEVREVGEGEELVQQLRVGRNGGPALVPSGELGDDAR